MSLVPETITDTNNSLYDIITNIFNYECDILNIQDKEGYTGYIDFIKKSNLNNNIVMKGLDKFNRRFLVFKAEFIYPDGKIIQSFTTFFQRYDNNLGIWHTCGNDGQLLMSSDGGMTKQQMLFIKQLLYEKTINLDKSIVINTRLRCYPNTYHFHEEIDISKIPLKVNLGHS